MAASRAPWPRRGVGAAAATGRRSRGAAPPPRAPGARLVRPAVLDGDGPIAWLRARVGETPFRPDRSASLDREPRGRLDRLDLFLLVVLVVGALFLRTYRLGDPARMHFDEVYHARTATEFLQSWRYGISHDIYEWTHPHLAKYAMAAGIVAFAGHERRLVERPGRPRARRRGRAAPRGPVGLRRPRRRPDLGGDRLGARRLRPRDPGLVRAGRCRRERGRLRRDRAPGCWSGPTAATCLALDTTALDAYRGRRPGEPPVEPLPVATLDGPVTRLAAYRDGSHAAAILADATVAVVDLTRARWSAPRRSRAPPTWRRVDDVTPSWPARGRGGPGGRGGELAEILGGDEATLPGRAVRRPTQRPVVDRASSRRRGAHGPQDRHGCGRARGRGVPAGPQMAVAGTRRRHVPRRRRGATTATVELEGGAAGLAQVTGVDDGTQLYVTSRTPRPATRRSP